MENTIGQNPQTILLGQDPYQVMMFIHHGCSGDAFVDKDVDGGIQILLLVEGDELFRHEIPYAYLFHLCASLNTHLGWNS